MGYRDTSKILSTMQRHSRRQWPQRAPRQSPWQQSLGNSMVGVCSKDAVAVSSVVVVPPLIMVCNSSVTRKMLGLFATRGEQVGAKKDSSESLVRMMPRPSLIISHRMVSHARRTQRHRQLGASAAFFSTHPIRRVYQRRTRASWFEMAV